MGGAQPRDDTGAVLVKIYDEVVQVPHVDCMLNENTDDHLHQGGVRVPRADDLVADAWKHMRKPQVKIETIIGMKAVASCRNGTPLSHFEHI